MSLPPAAIGLAILIPKFVSVFIDPIVGDWADRSAQGLRWRTVLIIAAFTVSASFATLFSSAYFQLGDAIAILAYVAFTFSYSAFAVPYSAAPVGLEAAELQRSQLIGLRLTYGFAGIIIGAALAPWLVDTGGGGSAGYAFMAFTLAAIIFANFLMTGLFGPAPRGAKSAKKPNGPFAILIPLRDSGFAKMAVIYGLTTIAFGAFGAGTPFLIKDTLGFGDSMVALAMLACFGAGFVSTPLWSSMQGRIGQRTVIVYGQALVIVGAMGLILRGVPVFVSGAGFVLIGIGFAAIQLACFAAIADCAAAKEQASASTYAALYTGAWVAIEKLGLATGAALAGLLLQITALPLSASLITSVVPAVLCMMAALITIQMPGAHATR